MTKGIRGCFITGLLVVVPLYITIYVLSLIVGFMDNVLGLLPGLVHPDTYLPFHIPGLGVIFTVGVIFLVGLLTKNIFGRALVVLGERLISKIPLLRMVYNATKQFLETFFSEEHEGFKHVVLVEFPRSGVYSVGFQTGRPKGSLKDKTGGDSVSVFVPTTPNPTTGFYMIVKESEVISIDLSVEDAFKIIMTAGMVMPDKTGKPGSGKNG
ncbi:MAG: DUF502 domain-containing protein, partial [Deltaproteobacteria bacterium]|nr:DUF502 domain-containing protein [Deltaproteobacteria bacterium]